MATQRPAWFRLPTMRPPAPAPAPAPATSPPRPPAIVRPAPPPPEEAAAPASQPSPKPSSPVATPTPSPPPAPQPSPPRASPPKVATSPPQIKTQTPSSSSSKPTPPLPVAETTNLKKATPLSSPKPSSHPPSPLQLPPAQIRPSEEEDREPKIEQKSVLVQEKPTKTNNAVPSKGKREPPTKDKGTIKKLSDSEDLGMRVITIAGENRGALMEITSSNKNTHPHGTAYTLANTKNDTAGDGKSEHKDKNSEAQSQPPPPMSTFLNSNVQGVNNSIVFNSSCHHNDPGIHLSLVRKLNASRGSHHG